METLSKTLADFDRKVKKERATEKYNDRMRKRLRESDGKGSPGKAHKDNSKEPQIRKVSTKVNKGEEFTRLSKYARRLLRRGY